RGVHLHLEALLVEQEHPVAGLLERLPEQCGPAGWAHHRPVQLAATGSGLAPDAAAATGASASAATGARRAVTTCATTTATITSGMTLRPSADSSSVAS